MKLTNQRCHLVVTFMCSFAGSGRQSTWLGDPVINSTFAFLRASLLWHFVQQISNRILYRLYVYWGVIENEAQSIKRQLFLTWKLCWNVIPCKTHGDYMMFIFCRCIKLESLKLALGLETSPYRANYCDFKLTARNALHKINLLAGR